MLEESQKEKFGKTLSELEDKKADQLAEQLPVEKRKLAKVVLKESMNHTMTGLMEFCDLAGLSRDDMGDLFIQYMAYVLPEARKLRDLGKKGLL